MKKSIFVMILLFLSWNMFSQELGTLTVEGKAIIKEVPENVLITINLNSVDSIYSICSDNLTKNSINLQNDLVKQGIDSKTIKANNFRIEENREFQNGNYKKLGYKGLIELTIEGKFSNQLLSTIMEIMKKSEYSFNYSVSFILSEEQKQALINYAIENAISDAKTKAEIIARAANIELVNIKSITYNNDYKFPDPESGFYDRVRYRAPLLATITGAAHKESNGISINQEEMTAEKTVTIEWITKSK
jgi:uncharacterized protein